MPPSKYISTKSFRLVIKNENLGYLFKLLNPKLKNFDLNYMELIIKKCSNILRINLGYSTNMGNW